MEPTMPADGGDVLEVIAAHDEYGRPIDLRCPYCGRTDIREHDRAERWNRIELDGSRLIIVQGSAAFETIGLVCCDCGQPIDAPSDFFAGAEWG